MKLNKTKQMIGFLILWGLFFLIPRNCYGSDLDVRIEIECIMEIDCLIKQVDKCIQKIVSETLKKNLSKEFFNTHEEKICQKICKIKKTVCTLENLIRNRPKSSIQNQDDLIWELFSSTLRTAKLLIRSVKIMQSEDERRDDTESKCGYRFSHLRGYSLAYSMFQHNKNLLIQYYLNQKNYKSLRDSINAVGDQVKKLKPCQRNRKFGLNFNYYAGINDDEPLRYIAMNYFESILICNTQIQIIPELGVDLDGNHHLFFGLALSVGLTKTISLSGGAIYDTPKNQSTKIGGHLGINWDIKQTVIIGLKYNTLFGIGAFIGLRL